MGACGAGGTRTQLSQVPLVPRALRAPHRLPLLTSSPTCFPFNLQWNDAINKASGKITYTGQVAGAKAVTVGGEWLSWLFLFLLPRAPVVLGTAPAALV